MKIKNEALENAAEKIVEADVLEGIMETVTQKKLFTSKRLIIAAGVAVAVVGTVLIIKKIRDNAEDDE